MTTLKTDWAIVDARRARDKVKNKGIHLWMPVVDSLDPDKRRSTIYHPETDDICFEFGADPFPKDHPQYEEMLAKGRKLHRGRVKAQERERLLKIEDMKKLDLFEMELRALLEKHSAYIGWTCDPGSDTHGITGDHIYISVRNVSKPLEME